MSARARFQHGGCSEIDFHATLDACQWWAAPRARCVERGRPPAPAAGCVLTTTMLRVLRRPMLQVLALLLPLQVMATHVPREHAIASSGSPACPCVNPWPDNTSNCGGAMGGRLLQINREHHFGVTNHTTVCAPLDYGSSECRAWDNASWNSACLAADGSVRDSGAAEWCAASWCYVDKRNCERPMDPADVEPGSASSGLFYSYETCGNLNTYSDTRHYNYLRGRHLRISYPSDSGSGYTLVTLPGGSRTGSMVEFMRSIAAEARFTWQEVALRDESSSRYSSSFTACVHQVALNETDLCIANFWVTTERMLIHPSFTAEVYDDEFQLIVKAVVKKSFWDKVARPFSQTVTPTAWLLVLLTLLVMSLAMVFIEGSNVGDSADKILTRMDEQSGSYSAQQRKAELTEARGLGASLRRAGISIYYAGIGVASATPKHETNCAAGMIVVMGFGIFCMLFVASYTGATASIMITEKERTAAISSLHELQGIPDAKICLYASQAKSFALQYPQFSSRLVAGVTAHDVLQSLDDGKCAGAVLFQDAWGNALAGRVPTKQNDGSTPEKNHCDKTSVGGSVMAISNAMPVRQDLLEPLSYLISKKRMNNDYAAVRDAARERFIGQDMCLGAGDPGDDVAAASIDTYALAGPIFISLLCSMGGVIIKAVSGENVTSMSCSESRYMHDEERSVSVCTCAILCFSIGS